MNYVQFQFQKQTSIIMRNPGDPAESVMCSYEAIFFKWHENLLGVLQADSNISDTTVPQLASAVN